MAKSHKELRPSTSYYIKGQRQYLILAFSGYVKKKGWDINKALTIAYELHKRTNDEDHIQQRLSAVLISYKKDNVVGYKLLERLMTLTNQPSETT